MTSLLCITSIEFLLLNPGLFSMSSLLTSWSLNFIVFDLFFHEVLSFVVSSCFAFEAKSSLKSFWFTFSRVKSELDECFIAVCGRCFILVCFVMFENILKPIFVNLNICNSLFSLLSLFSMFWWWKGRYIKGKCLGRLFEFLFWFYYKFW